MTMTTTTTATPTPPQEGQAAAQWEHPPPTLHLGQTQWDPSPCRPVQEQRQVQVWPLTQFVSVSFV